MFREGCNVDRQDSGKFHNHVPNRQGRHGKGKDRDDDPSAAGYVEKILIDTVPDKLKSTVLKAGHHGSETSSTDPFIDAIDPEIVVVCSGRQRYRGTYIPDASVLRRYCCHNSDIRIYRTDYNDEQEGRTAADDQDGDHVVVETNGQEIKVTALSAGTPVEISECLPACN